MSLTVTRTYGANTVLTEAQLDAAFDSIEAKFNSTLIAGTEIQSATIEAANLASNCVTLPKVADGIFTADASGRAKFADSFVNAAKLATDAVTTAKILDSNVTTAKINDGAVTQAKLGALNYTLSSSCGTYTTTSTSVTDITNLSVSITTTGRPVRLSLVSATADTSTGPEGTVGLSEATFAGDANLIFDRGGSAIARTQVSYSASGVTSGDFRIPCGAVTHTDFPAAGTYTYKLRGIVGSGTTLRVTEVKLLAQEL